MWTSEFIGFLVLSNCRLSLQMGTKTTKGVAVTESITIVPTTTDYSTSTIDSCDSSFGNCTTLNDTEPTTNPNKTNATHISHHKGKQEELRTWNEAYICTCNLHMRFCDINCCCDLDCSATDKAVFKHCEPDENRFFDDRYCKYTKYIYVNNTPFEWEVNQDGMFCVVSRNLPESHFVQKDEPIGTWEAFMPQRSFWLNEVPHSPHLAFSKNYAFGDSIRIIKNDSRFDILRMPKRMLSPGCTYEEDVHFLVNENSECSQAVIGEENAALAFSSYFSNIKIVAAPRLVNLTAVKKNFFHSCPKNVCLEIEPKLCDIHLSNCLNIGNGSNTRFQCQYQIRINLNHCQNALKRVHWKFFHNGTSGIYKVEILGALANFSYHFGRDEFEFIQEFSWEFLWNNLTRNFSEMFSGNPGYIVGKPILIGSKVIKANQTFIQRSSTRFMENFMVFPKNLEGFCVRNDTYYEAIEFGFNMRIKCRLQKRQSFSITQNASQICRNIQKSFFDLWGIETINSSMVFGLFGSALSNTLEDWSDVLYRKEPNTFLNQTQGRFINKNATLLCYNISKLLNVGVFHSRVDFKTVLNQQKILGVALSFDEVLNQNFVLKRINQSWIIDFGLDLISQVSFHDVTRKKVVKFVDPPSLDIRLPYDFFYPFIKIGNGSNRIWPNSFLLLTICVLKFLDV